MEFTDIFDINKVVEKLETQKRVTIGGFSGSSYTLFLAKLATEVSQVLCVADESNIDKYYVELKDLLNETILVNEEHPYYRKGKMVLTTADFLSQKVKIKEEILLSKNQLINVEELLLRLHNTGYTREDIVEEEGEYAMRGGILDVFEPYNEPIRIEFYGDRIATIRKFNIQNQRSVETVSRVTLSLATVDGSEQLIRLINKDAVAVSEKEYTLPLATLMLSPTPEIRYKFSPAYKYFGDLKRLREDIAESRYTFKFFIINRSLSERLKSLLGEIEISPMPVGEGFIDESTKVIYLTENELFGEIKRRKRVFRGLFVDDLMGLKENDFVVHSDYGIGQFKGLTFIDFENRKVECLRIDYAGNDRVFLPIERMNLLERYVATRESSPKLSKLGTEAWLRTKNRIRKATERLALNLINLYTRRSQEKGFSYSQDGIEMQELEASFPYEETEDQMKAIIEIKNDMQSNNPAERLVCGDVGYGKTELALRAAFKAALDSKQTMLLCPTTLLAFQHYNTFRQRLEAFPVNVEMVSRFRKKEELKKILKDIASGKIDIVIGTHRLLQPDIHFKNLGLLIIDEEQRFGVVHKEKIKNFIPSIDTFYLSATPIPRTLYMALTGLKNISNIYTPPPGRKDIITKIIFYDDDEICKIIKTELARGGQVFFVHNRIQTIETVRAKLLKIMPDLRICLLHGQMKEDISATRMVDFLAGKYDVLLSTAIVESGLDMPRVNTIIVDHAHKFGLADLHQLRGRVGRSDTQGFAYFIVPSRHKVTEEAHKRLGALISYTSLGSGFRLALRDMEIRGVGNLLGKEQSGHINSIGYHLYLKILGESVSSLKGEKVYHEPILDVKMDAYFPSTYIEKAYERTALYKRLLAIESMPELQSIREEIVDRFGKYPEEVENLFLLSKIRLKAREIGATEVVRRGKKFVYYKEGTIIYSH